MNNDVTIIYQARNKTFCITYWKKSEAEAFVNAQPASTGFRVETLPVFGDKDAWLEEQK